MSVDKSLSSLGDFTCTLPVSSLGKVVAGQVTVLKFCTLISHLFSALDSSSFVVIDSCVGTSRVLFLHLGEILAELDFGLPGLVGMIYLGYT